MLTVAAFLNSIRRWPCTLIKMIWDVFIKIQKTLKIIFASLTFLDDQFFLLYVVLFVLFFFFTIDLGRCIVFQFIATVAVSFQRRVLNQLLLNFFIERGLSHLQDLHRLDHARSQLLGLLLRLSLTERNSHSCFLYGGENYPVDGAS